MPDFYISGFTGNDTELQATVLTANGARTKLNWSNPNHLKSIPLDGQWFFTPVGKQLDQKWTDEVAPDTLEIPLMKFYAVFDSAKRDFASLNFDDSDWPTVKISDLFSSQTGGERILSGWNASQITSFDRAAHFRALGGESAVFTKKISLEGEVQKASLVVYTEPAFTLFINDLEVGKGTRGLKAMAFDIFKDLQSGENELRIEVPGNKGLLVEGQIETTNNIYSVLSNNTWDVALDRGVEKAFEVSKPPLGSFGVVEFPAREIKFPLTDWYRQPLPKGAHKILVPTAMGHFSFFINGKSVQSSAGIIDLTGLKESSESVLAVKCKFNKISDGLQEQFKVVVGSDSLQLASWQTYGLGWFTGRAIYTKEFVLKKNYLKEDVRLKLDIVDQVFICLC